MIVNSETTHQHPGVVTVAGRPQCHSRIVVWKSFGWLSDR